MAGIVHIPWYATFFRGDKFEAALVEVAAIATRYGATEYEVRRSREDRYRLLQTAVFEDKLDFERYWYGPEMSDFRARHGNWFTKPVVYEWWDRSAYGSRQRARDALEAGAQDEAVSEPVPAAVEAAAE